MTEDDISRGLSMGNVLTGEPYDAVTGPARVESVVAMVPGPDGAEHLWKLSHYYERLDDWNAAHGIAPNPFAPPAAEPMFELYDLTADPEERTNLATTDAASKARDLVVTEVRKDAAVVFTDAEEAFFRGGDEKPAPVVPTAAPPVESFADLDADYQPVSFWDRVRGKRAQPTAAQPAEPVPPTQPQKPPKPSDKPRPKPKPRKK